MEWRIMQSGAGSMDPTCAILIFSFSLTAASCRQQASLSIGTPHDCAWVPPAVSLMNWPKRLSFWKRQPEEISDMSSLRQKRARRKDPHKSRPHGKGNSSWGNSSGRGKRGSPDKWGGDKRKFAGTCNYCRKKGHKQSECRKRQADS